MRKNATKNVSYMLYCSQPAGALTLRQLHVGLHFYRVLLYSIPTGGDNELSVLSTALRLHEQQHNVSSTCSILRSVISWSVFTYARCEENAKEKRKGQDQPSWRPSQKFWQMEKEVWQKQETK